MITTLRILTFLLLALGGLHFVRINSPKAGSLGLPKMLAGALAPYLALISALGALLGLALGDPWLLGAGVAGAAISGLHFWRVIAPHRGFERAFGAGWQARLSPSQSRAMLKRRWALKLVTSPQPRWERDLTFWRIPGTQRDLLCDLWQPPQGVNPSGLGIVFFHGSGWHFLDKDFSTRPFFRHLASQGHVIMDVAYRMCPETDFTGIIGDAKRAIAWMKANASRFCVDPRKIVVMGASAGGHMSLLSAYAPQDECMIPVDVRGMDLSVIAVVSYYGPSDMRLYNQHAGRTMGFTQDDLPPKAPGLLDRVMDRIREKLVKGKAYAITHRQMMKNLLGGQPEEVSAAYDLASPVNYVTPLSPPTLLFHGEHDQIVPVTATRLLYKKLVENNVPAIYVEFPQTEHAFDVAFRDISPYSPAAQAALYDVERFLALLMCRS
jgi:acetyl esterase/lipase